MISYSRHLIKSSYYEANKEEFTLLNYQRVQIEQYLHHFFLQHGLLLQKLLFQINDKSLNLILSYYFLNHDSTPSKKRITKTSYILKRVQTRFHRNKQKQKTDLFQKRRGIYNLLISSNSKKHKEKPTNFKNISIATQYKTFFNKASYKTSSILKKHFFHEQILETVSLFIEKRFHVSLVFRNVNRGINLILNESERLFLKKYIILLKRYSKKDYFKDCLNIFIVASKIDQSSRLFSNILSDHLKSLRYHKPFLSFVSKLLRTIVISKIFSLKGIKLHINGRLNNKSRSSDFLVTLGAIPTINKNSEIIDYSESTCYTKNGTLGIKVWCNHI
jgi:Ribosomal protein S3, C-terminal domain